MFVGTESYDEHESILCIFIHQATALMSLTILSCNEFITMSMRCVRSLFHDSCPCYVDNWSEIDNQLNHAVSTKAIMPFPHAEFIMLHILVLCTNCCIFTRFVCVCERNNRNPVNM